jgi:poly(3-hydroxybutyrate) depolymerase
MWLRHLRPTFQAGTFMADRIIPSFMFLWPALAAASAREVASAIADEFAHLAVQQQPEAAAPLPPWATHNSVVLELPTVRLRRFGAGAAGAASLICAPFALHAATVADFAEGHSLVATLRRAGLKHLFVTDWRSAAPDMRYFSIDTYLADLNVAVDELGGQADIIGLCQGGWLALAYAARFPRKVRRLVIAGAPIDIAAGESGLSRLAAGTPLPVFHDLVRLGEGRVLGRTALRAWGSAGLDSPAIHELLQQPSATPRGATAPSEAIEQRFRDWYGWTVDLPGTYYLQVVEWLYKENRLATGRFMALGRRIDLAAVQMPLFLLAARDDELVAPDQVFAAANLVGTGAGDVVKAVAPCRHLGLFMGAATLASEWQDIARWLRAPPPAARNKQT